MNNKYTSQQKEAFYKTNPSAIGNQGTLDLLRGVVRPRFTLDHLQSKIEDLEMVIDRIPPGYFICAEKFMGKLTVDFWKISDDNFKLYLNACKKSTNPRAKLYVQLAIIRIAVVLFREFSNLVPSNQMSDLNWRSLFLEASWWINILEKLEDKYGAIYLQHDYYWE